MHCASGLADNDPATPVLQALQDEGQKYTKEKNELKNAGAFDGYGTADRINDWADRNQVSNRAVGAVQGVMGAATAAAAFGAGCSTLVACGAGAVVAGTSLDYSKAGLEQLVSGNPTPTHGEQMLQTLGMGQDAAALTYGAVSLGGAIGAAAVTNQAAKRAAEANSAAHLSYTTETFETKGLLASPELLQMPQARAVVDSYIAAGLSPSKATENASALIESGIALPKMMIAGTDTELIKIVPKNALSGDRISGRSAYFMTREQYDLLAGLAPNQIASRLGLPVEQAIRGAQLGFDVYSMKPLLGETPTVFSSEIAPIQQGTYSASGGAHQVLVPNRTQWTDPNANKIGEIPGRR